MTTLKDSVNLLFELSKFLYTGNSRMSPSGTNILKNKKSFITIIKKTGKNNPIVEYIQEIMHTDIPYKSLFKTNSEFDNKGYYDSIGDLKINYNKLLYGYPADFIYILKEYDLKLYIRETIGQEHGRGSYNYLFKNFKREGARLIYMENSGCLKFLETVGLLWDGKMREMCSNRIESRKNKKN